jgi:hypothetical protein
MLREPRLVGRWRHAFANGLASVALVAVIVSGTSSAAEDSKSFVDITVQNAVARVGEKAVIVAKISLRDGLQITDSYRHRITVSPSEDVELERNVVRGVIEDNGIVFTVGVIAKRAGTHTVRGLIRFSYHYGGELDIRTARFEATVTATE